VPSVDDLLRARLPAVGSWDAGAARHAAVLCALVERRGEDHVLLVVRPAGLRQHAGQIAFPGGMRSGEETVLATALREAAEEVALPPREVVVLGALPPRTSSTGIHVHALVARVPPFVPRPDPIEVARVLYAPLADLADDTRWSERPAPGGATGAQPPTSPHFALDGELLWGLTARFVRDLLTALRPR
jgi:8-oxo-dGTP pyrophosphatase MutT (NUDIX family)